MVKADERYFPLSYKKESGDVWGLISSIQVEEGIFVITLRSIVQVSKSIWKL